MTHALKTWPELFAALADGSKTADVRKNDRGFQVGDDVIFQEYDNKEKKYTGREVKSTVTHILAGDQFGIGKHFCVLSFKKIEPLVIEAKRDVVQFIQEPAPAPAPAALRPDEIAPVQEVAPTVHETPQPQTATELPL